MISIVNNVSCKVSFICVHHRVFYKRHKLIREVIKIIVLQFLFDSQHLEKYITQRIKQFSSHVRIVDNITQALDSSETEQIIEERLTYLYSQPESYLLEQLGLKKDVVKPMIKPSIISLCAESAPYVLDMVAESGQVIIICVYSVSDNLIMFTVVHYVCKYSTGILPGTGVYNY